MTIIDLPNRAERVTPRAPIMTPVMADDFEVHINAKPVLGSEAAEKCIAAIDEDLDCVFCVAATLAGTQDVPDETVNALKTLHARMKRNVDALYNLG